MSAGKKKVIFGLEKVHVAFRDTSGYVAPVAIPGAVNLALNAEGDSSTFYADNIPYFTLTSNNGYTGDLEMALIPDDILAKMLGWEVDNNGMLVEVADGIQKEFALLFEVKGNVNNKRYVYYNCLAARPTEEHGTKTESITPTTQTLSVTITPIEIGGKMVVKGGLELSASNGAVYNSWYDAVVEPDAVPAVVTKTSLAATIALAETLSQEDYTTETWGVLSTALTAAETANDDNNATQVQVNKAERDLREAILNLIPGGE